MKREREKAGVSGKGAAYFHGDSTGDPSKDQRQYLPGPSLDIHVVMPLPPFISMPRTASL
ncbi:MAG: hypothetical protein HZB84_06340 [Deltaproteobacteria bacterium]|nr:hypothetical protein [Deltaproteobacteria bacterium]MBI5903083.1 hypothetical protein [Deltaproteobacteria bacterium]